ncbi:MAG: DEAD/DEAH box helicase family protein [Thermoflexales bacterium]|nr:DEAD/DEAH box helicase family protein [Thermoflexales bacterium]
MPLSERATRKSLIDKALTEVGWTPIIPYDAYTSRDLVAFEEYPTANGPADYALFHNDEPLAIVEAKKLGVGPQNVLKQAQRYAQGIADSPFDFDGFRVPFVYSTNGETIWFQDLREPRSRSREVAKFHTPGALRDMLTRDMDPARDWLRTQPVEYPTLRPYQRAAIESVESALLANRRRMLVAMATGTGKTLTAIALLYRLLKSGYARRILFLVDRRALAAQAVVAFSRFEPEPGLKFDRIYEVYSQRFHPGDLEDQRFDPRVLPTSYLTNPDLGQAFVYVCTIQRMQINLFGLPEGVGWASSQAGESDDESDAPVLNIPIHAFDVIVADECHRGYTASEMGKWRQALKHFDAIQVGLTATPAVHTVSYFGDIAYRYEYDRAVSEGYLVDYDPIVVSSEIAAKGAFLHPGEEVSLQDRETGQLRFEMLEDERELPAATLDTEWAAPDRDRKIVQEIAHHLRQQEQERKHFPKTLIFAHNDLPHVSHADRLVALLRDEFDRGDAFVCKITGSPSVDRPLQRIREFRNRPEPGVVVTVDLLSTGVDIPALECIVFLRPIQSRILFEQMMGRGTRRCDEIDKTHFTVFDAVGVLEYFAKASGFTTDPPDKPTRKIAELIQAIYDNQDRDYNVRVLVRRLQRIAKDVSGEGREMFKRFIPDRDIAAFARALPQAIDEDWARTMQLLRDPDFQQLLHDYPRARRFFVIADSAQDTVVSGYLIRMADGKSVRPADYLAAFEAFVRENPDHVEAIRILLDRPVDWRTDALQELRHKLAARPESFTEDRLRRAYQHELADIISIVKHAAKGEPLLSAEERVRRAVARVCAGKVWTLEQEKWLELIRNHLVENLAIDREDFGLLTFSRAGATWERVNRDFAGHLEGILAQINEAMAT